MAFPDEFYVHSATVETYTGSGNIGPLYSSGVTIPCWLDATATLVETPTGEQVTARTTTLYCSTTYAALFTAESRVTSPQFGGKPARVQSVNVLSGGSLGLPDHIEVTLL